MMNLTNKNICEREKNVLSSIQKLPYCPIAIKSGKGALLYDYDGNEYIDFLSSASSANLGHGNEEITQAVKKQMDQITQYTIAYFTCESPILLAEKIIDLCPGDNNKKVLYSTTGSESIDAAIKLSKGYTGRNKIISFNGSYHGSTYGALSVSAISLNMRKKIGSLLPDVYHFNYPICIKCPYNKTESECELECLEEIKTAFQLYLPADEVAAVFFEPIAGDSGIIVPPKRYVESLYKLCKDNNILFVVDEIQQSLGRSGYWFSIEHFHIEPDLIVMGKSLGGGFPLGLVVGKSEIMECLKAPAHAFTLSGNATVCVASLKMIEVFERDKIIEKSKEKGVYLTNKLNILKEKYPNLIKDVRGLGLSIGVDLPDKSCTKKICYQCIKNGLLLISLGENTLRIQPPLVITKEEIDKSMEILENALNDFINGNISDDAYIFINGW